jgi:hypothetical protein
MRTSLVGAALTLVMGCVPESHTSETSESKITYLDPPAPGTMTSTADDVVIQFSSASISEGWLSVELTRSEPIYVLTCGGFGVQGLEPSQEDWVTWEAYAVNNGSFVDGEYNESPGCDYVDCVEFTRFGDTLTRLEPVGEVSAERGGVLPDDWRDAGGHSDGGVLLPVFESRTLTGSVRVWFDYHLDVNCSDSGATYQLELDLDRLELSESG